jgi:hypothetical protein
MTVTAVVFFLFGATVLWGGLAVTLYIAMKNNKREEK